MLILYDFKCTTCDVTEEKLIAREDRDDMFPCNHCRGTTVRVVSPVRCSLEGVSGHFPGAAMKWDKAHEKAGRQPSETYPSGW